MQTFNYYGDYEKKNNIPADEDDIQNCYERSAKIKLIKNKIDVNNFIHENNNVNIESNKSKNIVENKNKNSTHVYSHLQNNSNIDYSSNENQSALKIDDISDNECIKFDSPEQKEFTIQQNNQINAGKGINFNKNNIKNLSIFDSGSLSNGQQRKMKQIGHRKKYANIKQHRLSLHDFKLGSNKINSDTNANNLIFPSSNNENNKILNGNTYVKNPNIVKKSLYQNCFEVLEKNYNVMPLHMNGCLVKLFLHDSLSVILCVCYYSAFFNVTYSTKKPILCDITTDWPKGIFYGDRTEGYFKDVPSCDVLCDSKVQFWTLDNNYLFSMIFNIIPFLIRLNMSCCLLYLICKKFHCFYILFILAQLVIASLSQYFAITKNDVILMSFLWYLCFFLTFLQGKSQFYLSIIFLLMLLYVFGFITFTQKIFMQFVSQSIIAAVLFPIYHYVIIVILNFLMNHGLVKFMPHSLKYYLYFFVNNCFEAIKAGFYYVSCEKGFANFHFSVFIFFDCVMSIAKKHKLFERCFNSIFSICTVETIKTEINDNDKLNDIANIEAQFFSIFSLFYLIFVKFVYFGQSYKFTDCFGTPNKEYFSPNFYSKVLLIVLAGKFFIVFIFTNLIFPKCFKTSLYYVPVFKGFKENFIKISINLFTVVIVNFYSLMFGLFFYKELRINQKQDMFLF